MNKETLARKLSSGDCLPLFQMADAVRLRYCGNGVHLRAIVEFSNYCSKNCLYCGLRRDNKKIKRYRMSPAEIFGAARQAAQAGIRTVVLQSGEEKAGLGELFPLIGRIKKELGCAVTLSLGEKTAAEYRALKDAGADRYLLKFETSDEKLFRACKPDSDYSARFDCIETLVSLGFQTGTGNIVGLPGQTVRSLAGDILRLKELAPDMISVTPFISNPDTPFAGTPCGDLEMTLRVLALSRIETPDAHMPATTAIRTLHKEGAGKALACGANVIMPNFTPVLYRPHYSIYPGKESIIGDPSVSIRDILKMLEKMGRKVAPGYGHGRRHHTDSPL
jgi:biotin synthase